MRTIVCASLLLLGSMHVAAQTATQDIVITANVTKACTIIGGAADTAEIGVDANGSVITTDVTPDNAPYANVACNGPSSLRLTSLNGGVVNASPAPGFSHIIDYTASATWNSVTATIDTSLDPTAAGAEVGVNQPVGTAATGSLVVTITPLINALPLVQGTYTDTLRVTLTPQ